MTSEGILTEDELPFDSMLGQKVVRKLQCLETYQFYRAVDRQKRIAQAQKERRIFGDGARVTMAMDPVLMARIAGDPRFGYEAFGEAEFESDMAKWHPEFMVKTRHQTKHFAMGSTASKPDKDAKYLIA